MSVKSRFRLVTVGEITQEKPVELVFVYPSRLSFPQIEEGNVINGNEFDDILCQISTKSQPLIRLFLPQGEAYKPNASYVIKKVENCDSLPINYQIDENR